MLMQQISSNQVLETAYHWLCKARSDYSSNDDVWSLRQEWVSAKLEIQHRLRAGVYEFEPLTEYRFSGQTVSIWAAADALVLKAMALVLQQYWQPLWTSRCFHIKGHGGINAAVKQTYAFLRSTPEAHVMKSDIQRYYASMDHHQLYQLCEQYLPRDKAVMRLIWQYLKRIHTYGGEYREYDRGIVLGCPLSPLMGALYLKPLDDLVLSMDLYYARYMDDWVILAPTRWKLRRVVSQINQVLSLLSVEKHPNKTFIGRGERGFDFLGYFLTPNFITVSDSAIERCMNRLEVLEEEEESPERAYVRKVYVSKSVSVVQELVQSDQ